MKTVSTMKDERPKTKRKKKKFGEANTAEKREHPKKTVINIYRELRDIASVKQEWIIITKR